MGRIAVVGAGAWGTALAVVAARAGHEVTLWGRDREAVAAMARARVNAARLPGIDLPPEVIPSAAIGDAAGADCVLLAVPAQVLRTIVGGLPTGPAPLVITAKGLERWSGLRLSEVVLQERPGAAVAALSGPSFAPEVARGQPTAVTIASEQPGLSRTLAELLAGPALVEAIASSFRIRADKARRELGWTPRYESFAAALPDLLPQLRDGR